MTIYIHKVEDQINRSSFIQLDHNLTQEFDFKVEKWLEKWTKNKSIGDKWQSYLKPTNDSTPDKMYGLIKTHKVGNPAWVITSGCSTAMETVLFDLGNDLQSRLRDMAHMPNIVDELNRSNLPSESILVGFDIVNMFPSIDNNFRLKTVFEILESFINKFPPTQSVIEALELSLTCNNSIINNKNYLQTDDKTQGPHMSCSYADLAPATFDNHALAYNCSPTMWKRFCVDAFVVWRHGSAALNLFWDYLNNLDDTGKIKFTMQVANKNGPELLDLKLKIIEGKRNVDVYSKPTNGFMYVVPSTCNPYKNIKNIPKSIALRLQQIFDTDEKYNQCIIK